MFWSVVLTLAWPFIRSQNDRMSIDALNDLKQRILSAIQLDGIEAAQSRYIETLPALSLERRKMQGIFSQLEIDQAGKWDFRRSEEEKR